MENVFPQFAKTVYKEIRALLNEEIEGINLELNEQDLTDIKAIIIGPKETPFENGSFHVRLYLPNDYPAEPPKGFFITKIFHPNINARTGEICVDTLKKEWNKEMGIRHILLTIRCLLIAPNPESALNEEAGRLLLEDYNGYQQQAKIFTEIHAMTPEMHVRPSYLQDQPHSSILRDTNGPPAKAPTLMKSKKSVSVVKKTLKRL